MKNFLIDLPSEGGFVMSQGDYNQLREARDRLFLLAQFCNVAPIDPDDDSLMTIRRTSLGNLFADLSCQIREVLNVVEHIAPLGSSLQAH
ncbi:hypothetical protein [Dyella sp. 2HG41-7]|uniref:XAC0095 family protein n=1 Tax=Dyella sp. 2HG41-7 TaxID=2883239 RepID=UPI001F20A559|nr:hypothetical protein [Dyella sp. 2HG41-7]